MLVFAIVVCENYSTTNIAVLTNFAVARVCKMADFAAAANTGVFKLYKIAHATTIVNNCARTDSRKRANYIYLEAPY